MKTKLFFILTAVMVFASCGYNPPQTPNSPQGGNSGSGGNSYKPSDPDVVASFSYEKSHPFYVHFKNKSKNSTSYEWDFGDGKTSKEASPVHQYAGKGVYKVTLKAISLNQRDVYTTNITVTEPTTCYVTGVEFEAIPKNNEYYSVRFTDDYMFFETCYWYTDWCLLSSSANIPHNYPLKNMYKLNFNQSTYVMRLYQNSKNSGTGTQLKAWTVSTSDVKNKHSEKRTGTSDNVKVTLLLKWYD